MAATRFTNLEVTGTAEFKGDVSFKDDVDFDKGIGLTEATYKVTSADGAAAAGTAPTKAEFDAVVTLANELKSKLNKLAKQLATGSDT